MAVIEFLNGVTTGLGFWGGMVFGLVVMALVYPWLAKRYKR